MKKFEYSVVRYMHNTNFIEFWNSTGEKGWEFCMEVTTNKTYTDFLVKRIKG